jgi:hypothetical protein
VFCSETLRMTDPTLTQLEKIRGNLAGVQRVFLSGGEPLLRRDLPDIVDMFAEFIIGLILAFGARRLPPAPQVLTGQETLPRPSALWGPDRRYFR